MAWLWWSEFDKRFIGQWKREDGARALSIRQSKDESVEVKISWLPHGSSNIPAVYVECTNAESLYFFHNDRYNRAEYILTLVNDDLLRCEFTQIDITNEPIIFNYERISHTPYDLDPPKHEIESRIEILRGYAEYGNDKKLNVKFKYKFDERENMLDIIEKYNLDELVKGKNDIETAITLMNWFCERYKHGADLDRTRTPQAIMEFADNNGGKTNCRGLSIALAHLIRAYNIKAFHITCMPYEEPFNECHVVVCVYCESVSKWIMLDPSFNIYLKNKRGEIIGVDEFRDILISGDELFVSEGMIAAWIDSLEEYRDYMAKNLVRLERGIVERYGCDLSDGRIILIPEKYMQNEAKYCDENKQKCFTSSKEEFWRV